MRIQMASRDYDWRTKKIWPYKGNNHPERDPQYIKERDELFRKSGNGWWWGWHLVRPERRPIDLWSGKKFGVHNDFELEGDENET